MTKTAAVAFEVRWRKNSDPANLWSTPVSVGADGHVSVPGLERVTDYTFEARAISACGAKSAWATQTFNLPDAPAGTITLNDARNVAQGNAPLVPNGNFANGLTGWTGSVQWTAGAGGAVYTGYAGAGTNDNLFSTTLVPVVPGQLVYIQAVIEAAGANGTCAAAAVFKDTNGTNLSYITTAASGGNVFTGRGVAPVNAASVEFYLSASNVTAGNYTCSQVAMTLSAASTQDHLPDGGTYGRVNKTNLTGNNVDLGKSGVAGRTLVNIADDAGSSRFAVSNIDGNRRALIDATQAGHVGAWNLDSRVADGTNFRRVGTGYADTSGRIVNLWDGTAIRSATNTWDGANRARTGLDASGVLVSGLHPIDNLKDGTFARTLGASLQNGVPIQMAGGKNVLANGSFSSNVTGTPIGLFLATGASASDGWTVGTISSAHGVIYESSNAGNDILIRLAGGASIPANAELDTFVGTAARASVTGGAPFAFTFTRDAQSNIALPSGITVTLRTYVAWYRGDGSISATTIIDAGTNSLAKAPVTTTGITPSDAVSAAIWLQAIVTNTNSTATAVGASGQLPADMRWYNVSLVMASNLDYEAVDGTVNGRMAMADVYNVGGANRVGLRVAGSGHQVGDQRNLLPITVASLRSVLNTSPITYTITSGSPNSTVNFSVAAFTLQAGSASINYNAASHAIAQANGTTTTWYLLFIDPEYAGGTQSLVVTTSPTVAAQYDGAVNIGSATVTVASGGGGSSGSGSGGGGWCICDDMWIDGGTQAKDARPGHAFDCCDLPTRGTETFKHALQSVEYHYEQCVRLTTEGGAVLDCGHTTPFDTVDGCTLRAPDMQGELVLTDHGLEKVASVEWIGVRRVCYFHFGGISYAAGRDTRPWYLRWLPQWLLPRRLRRNVDRIYSHNTATKP